VNLRDHLTWVFRQILEKAIMFEVIEIKYRSGFVVLGQMNET